MRSSLLALSLLLSTTAFAADTPAPAGDAPPAKAKEEAAKPDPDVAAASVEEDAQPKKRSISMRGRSLSYTVTPGHLTIRDDDGAPKARTETIPVITRVVGNLAYKLLGELLILGV